MNILSWLRGRDEHWRTEELSAYLDAELPAARSASLEAHLASCNDCAGALDELGSVKAALSRLPRAQSSRSFVLTPAMAQPGESPAQPAHTPRRLILAPAVALSLLIALVAVDLSQTTGSGDSLATSGANDAVALAEEGSSESREAQSSATAAGDSSAGSAGAPPADSPVTGRAAEDAEPDLPSVSPRSETSDPGEPLLSYLQVIALLAFVFSALLLFGRWIASRRA